MLYRHRRAVDRGLSQACAEEKWDDADGWPRILSAPQADWAWPRSPRRRGISPKTAREGEDRHDLRNAAQMVVGEHVRARKALKHLYPDVA